MLGHHPADVLKKLPVGVRVLLVELVEAAQIRQAEVEPVGDLKLLRRGHGGGVDAHRK